MDKEIDFSTMPRNYEVCWHRTCPMADKCLRQLAAEHLPETTRYTPSVNLRTVHPETGTCPEMRPVRWTMLAYGMKHIYDNVRTKDKEYLYQNIWFELGNSMYYRYRNGVRPITPQVRDIIEKAFRKYGYTDPIQYERWSEAIEW